MLYPLPHGGLIVQCFYKAIELFYNFKLFFSRKRLKNFQERMHKSMPQSIHFRMDIIIFNLRSSKNFNSTQAKRPTHERLVNFWSLEKERNLKKSVRPWVSKLKEETLSYHVSCATQ